MYELSSSKDFLSKNRNRSKGQSQVRKYSIPHLIDVMGPLRAQNCKFICINRKNGGTNQISIFLDDHFFVISFFYTHLIGNGGFNSNIQSFCEFFSRNNS